MVHDRRGLARVRAEVDAHLGELEQVVTEVTSYAAGLEDPDLLRLRALGSLLHDFYTGADGWGAEGPGKLMDLLMKDRGIGVAGRWGEQTVLPVDG